LSYLKQFPHDSIKIDRSFVSRVAVSADDEAIIRMAHALSLTTVAEGLETRAQQRLLTDLGSQYSQGYPSRAMPPVEVGRT
jgi:EAL domain-containing protein (putative c-di-GMP-specific phosphodiesterase class I)